jgi:hypothetical protein
VPRREGTSPWRAPALEAACLVWVPAPGRACAAPARRSGAGSQRQAWPCRLRPETPRGRRGELVRAGGLGCGICAAQGLNSVGGIGALRASRLPSTHLAGSSEGLVRQLLPSRLGGSPATQYLRDAGRLLPGCAPRGFHLGEHLASRQLPSPPRQRSPTAWRAPRASRQMAHRRSHLRGAPAAQPPQRQGQPHGHRREVLARHCGRRHHPHHRAATAAAVATASHLLAQR